MHIKLHLKTRTTMSKSIDYIQIFGERNSGTNYLKQLLEINLDPKIEIGSKFGWKHGFTHKRAIKNKDTEHTLFLVLTKDPYSWLISMNQRPHQAVQSIDYSA